MKTAGKIVSDYLYEKGITKTSLAEKIRDSNQNLGKRLRTGDLNFALLVKISDALDHDFFADISKEYKASKIALSPAQANDPVEQYGNTQHIVKEVIKELEKRNGVKKKR